MSLMTYTRLIPFFLSFSTLIMARPARADNGISFRHQLDMGVGWVNSNTLDNAFDGPGLRLSFEANTARVFVGLLADAQTGLGRAHFMKDGSASVLALLGSTLSLPELALRPSFRFGVGRAGDISRTSEWSSIHLSLALAWMSRAGKRTGASVSSWTDASTL